MSIIKYRTCLISCDHEELPEFSLRGRSWFASLEEDRCGVPIKNNNNTQREIVINAQSSHTAQNALKLIMAASVVTENFDGSMIYECEAIPEDEIDERKRDCESDYGVWGGAYWPRITVDVAIAAKASRVRAHQYAIHKYRLSKHTASASYQQLHPAYWKREQIVSKSPLDHVLAANSIIMGYSVIEELGLEIRASNKNPSRNKQGDWNPSVRMDLESRLQRANIALDKTIVWYRRGPRTRIERKYKHPPGELATWSHSGIRDIKIDVCDAIDYASKLRSRVSSHRLHHLSESLTAYDVANVQQLARYLILGKLGFWQYRLA